jgi:hypothetical protein
MPGSTRRARRRYTHALAAARCRTIPTAEVRWFTRAGRRFGQPSLDVGGSCAGSIAVRRDVRDRKCRRSELDTSECGAASGHAVGRGRLPRPDRVRRSRWLRRPRHVRARRARHRRQLARLERTTRCHELAVSELEDGQHDRWEQQLALRWWQRPTAVRPSAVVAEPVIRGDRRLATHCGWRDERPNPRHADAGRLAAVAVCCPGGETADPYGSRAELRLPLTGSADTRCLSVPSGAEALRLASREPGHRRSLRPSSRGSWGRASR